MAAPKGRSAGTLSGLLGQGSMGRQLLVWAILSNAISEAAGPIFQQLRDEVWPLLPSTPLSPADAADMVVRGVWDEAEGSDEAKHAGVNSDRFHRLVRITGEPISPRDALEALRRGIIPDDRGPGGGPSFMESVRQSRVRTEWADTLRALQWAPLPPADAVDAVVESQISKDEGRAKAKISGVTDEDFDILVNTRGRPPSPTELVELYKRGYIPLEGTGPDQTTVQQGIYEGATKNKWWQLIAKLGEYLPPPRTITALEREGAITQEQAQHLYQQQGLSPELAAIYATSASHQKLQKHRDIAEGQALDLYEAHAITAAVASSLLATLGYNAEEIAWLLVLRDIQRSIRVQNAAISRVGNLYVTRKMVREDVVNALNKLGVLSAQQTALLTAWDLERDATIRVLTEAQVVGAYHYQVITLDEATNYLEAMGYTPFDAWVLISVHEKAPQGEPPAAGRNVQGRAQ